MDEKAFLNLADAEMARLEQQLESAFEAADVDADIEPMPGGILELSFENGSKIIINRHLAAKEIWVAARSGGFHFKPQDGAWLNTRDGEALPALLERVLSEQAGVAIKLV
jgi:CyaY protein